MSFARLVLIALLIVLPCGVAKSQRLSVNIRDAQLSDAVALLSAQSGATILAEEEVRNLHVTLEVHDVGLADALTALANTNRLTVRRAGTAFVIGTSYRTLVLPLVRGEATDVARTMV
ncbi:MAG: hypothetical protein M3M96_04055, partial [Candidatus Eremiobacteraeota bacterium]|nr:hypothetical protein [Candidatus Eremiobacteraeota bacterium]